LRQWRDRAHGLAQDLSQNLLWLTVDEITDCLCTQYFLDRFAAKASPGGAPTPPGSDHNLHRREQIMATTEHKSRIAWVPGITGGSLLIAATVLLLEDSVRHNTWYVQRRGADPHNVHCNGWRARAQGHCPLVRPRIPTWCGEHLGRGPGRHGQRMGRRRCCWKRAPDVPLVEMR
jgi:hypothetical protein